MMNYEHSTVQSLKDKSAFMHTHRTDSFLLNEEAGCSLCWQAEAQGGEKRFWQGMKHPHPQGFNLVASSSAAQPGLR